MNKDAPEVSVHLGHSLDPEKIKEGDDVYFECTVLSKPPVHNVIWKHNGVKLVAGSGIILSNMSLVVQGVTRSHGGNYTCHATNVRKTSASAPMHLDVKYTPFCASVQRQHHSVGKLENAEISCKVDANPKNVSFRWTFNNTAEAIDVPEGRFVVVGTESRVNYTPMNELDYGTLLCWANNSIGIQQYPCVFHIVAAGKPDPPHNCRVFDVTISSFQVMCLPGDDGGLNQMFILHLYKVGAVSPMAEFSQTSPSFTINNLQPATSYRIVLASVNDKGTSRLIELNAYTIKVLEKLEETSAEPARDRVRGKGIPLEVILGIIAGVVSLILASVVVVWFRVCRVHTSDEEETDESAGSGSEASSKCQLKDTATAETAVSEATPQVTRHHDIQQSADPSSWSVQGPLIATISAPPYVVAGGDKQYPLATGAPAPASEVTGPQYSQYPEQGSYYTYSQCSAEVQLPTPARKQHNVPYYTDSAQLQQVQDPSSIGPSSLDYNSCVLQLPPPLGHLDQEEKYLVSSQRGELGPAEGQVAATGQDHGQAFPALLHILPGSVSKAQTSSHCSIHHCQNELFPVLESSSIPSVNQGMNRKGSLKVLSQYRDAIPDPLPTSVPSFQSMEDVSKSQRKYTVPVDQFTTSLNRAKHFKTEPSKEGVDACQLLTNTIPRSQRKNKMESSV
ncbi:uncharacterized protein [Palaemon carinicauda]|uniref:uncharacterized protein n=1 Tax=Palaemon carinicauda TaxID=392227 RepID=UPI0035B60DB3